MMPWSIDLQTTKTDDGTMNVTAQITYPCPEPFDCSAYPASNSSAHIYLPSNTELLDPSASIDIGSLAEGKNVTVSWNVHVDPKAVGSNITVSAGGRVSGSLPQVYWRGNQVSYPAYNYTDEIGGKANISVI